MSLPTSLVTHELSPGSAAAVTPDPATIEVLAHSEAVGVQSKSGYGNHSRSRFKSSRFRGVSKCSKDGRWQARIRVGKVVKYLGRFCSQEEAAKAYDRGALRYHSYRAVTNFDKSIYGKVEAAKNEEIEKEIEKAKAKRAKRKKRSFVPKVHMVHPIPQVVPDQKRLRVDRSNPAAPILGAEKLPIFQANSLSTPFKTQTPLISANFPSQLPQQQQISVPPGFALRLPNLFSFGQQQQQIYTNPQGISSLPVLPNLSNLIQESTGGYGLLSKQNDVSSCPMIVPSDSQTSFLTESTKQEVESNYEAANNLLFLAQLGGSNEEK